MKRNMNKNQCFKLLSFILCLSMLVSISLFPANTQDDISFIEDSIVQENYQDLLNQGEITNIDSPIVDTEDQISLTSTSVTSTSSVHDFSELLSEPTVDGYIYSFKNVYTSRYASSTTDSAYANTHFNIFQQESNTSSAQSFRLDDAGDGYYYIIPLELNQAETRKMCGDVFIIEELGDTLSNVSYKVFSDSSVYEFRWKIECYAPENGASEFVIKLYEEDPKYDYLLTAFTNDNGNHNNTGIEGNAAIGNIGLTKIDIKNPPEDKCLWKLESGGRQQYYGINLRTLTSYFDICMDIQNTPYINCPVMNYGDTCSIGTSVNHVMTIDTASFRVNPSLNPGYTTIMVVVSGNNGVNREIVQKGAYVYITPGMHYLSDATDTYVLTASLTNQAHMASYNGSEPTDNNKLYELIYVGQGKYCIRSKINNAYVWSISAENNLILYAIGIYGDYSSMPTSYQWTIESTTNGYRIYNYFNRNLSLTAPTPLSNGALPTISAYTSSGTGQYWNIQRAYFLSGYELEYTPLKWNDLVWGHSYPKHIQYYTNCYSYAYNNQTQYYIGNTSVGSMQPGLLGGVYNKHIEIFSLGWSLLSAKHLKELLNLDASAENGITFVETGKYRICPAGTYKVALWYNMDNGDYHWYRQNDDGTWSHKQGPLAVSKLDANKNPILDPQYAANTYTNFLGYYYVVPFNVITPYSSMKYRFVEITSYYPDDFQ